jgi:DNA-binding NarL/FixJ family response regulator
MGMMKTVLVDDHELFLQGLRIALEASNDPDYDMCFDVVGTATTGSAVVPLVNRLRPDVVLLDVGLPGIDGFTVLDLLNDRFPDVKVVMLSAMEQPEHVQAALMRGAAGYIMKTINPGDIAGALRQILEGSVYIALPAGESATPVNDHGLSPRELEILEQVARGLSNSAIGEELYVTEQTIKFHLTNVYRKLGVSNRTAAAREAHRLGIARNPLAEIA